MLKLYVVALFAVAASAIQMKFDDCANHEVTTIDVLGCGGNDPNVCPLRKGHEFQMTINFVANQNSAKATFAFSADLGGITIPVPGIDTDACHHMSCPLVKGQKYSYKFTLKVPKVVPTLKSVVKAALTGEHGTLACVHMKGGVQD